MSSPDPDQSPLDNHDGGHARAASREPAAAVAEQSWHNPSSRWRKKRRWIALGYSLGAGFFLTQVILQTAFLIFMESSTHMNLFDGSSSSTTLLLFMGVLAIGFAGAAIWMAREARKQMRLTQRILQHDGAVCPWCERAIEPHDPHDAAPDASLHCSHCDESCTLAPLQQYWTDLALNQMAAWEWSYKHRTKPPRKPFERLLYRMREVKMPTDGRPSWKLWLMLQAMMFIPLVFLLWLAFRNIWLAAVASGIACVVIALFTASVTKKYAEQYNRDRRERFCTGCNYQLPPGDSTPPRCPECGSDWQSAGSVYTGHILNWRNLAPGMVVFGVIIAFLFFGPMSPLGIGMQIRTTNSLIKTVTTTRSFVNREWEELNQRELTPDVRLRLAEGLLTRRDDRHTLDREANDWFFTQIVHSNLPQHIVDRFGRGLVIVDFDAPSRVRTGEDVTIGLRNINRVQIPLNSPLEPALYFAGYTLNDDPTPIGRADNALDLFSFGTVRTFYGMTDMASRYDSHELKFTPSNSGEYVIRARYWLALHPIGTGALNQPINWKEDGSPALPPGTLWSDEIIIEHRLTVTDR